MLDVTINSSAHRHDGNGAQHWRHRQLVTDWRAEESLIRLTPPRDTVPPNMIFVLIGDIYPTKYVLTRDHKCQGRNVTCSDN